MALPSSVSHSISEKCFWANSETKYILSRSLASCFCSSVRSVSSTSILYFLATYLMASGYVKCSCSIKKAMTFPPLPLLKSFQICFTGDTIKLGERSSVNGLKPLKLAPDFFNCTKSPITSSKRAVSYTWSMVVFAIKTTELFNRYPPNNPTIIIIDQQSAIGGYCDPDRPAINFPSLFIGNKTGQKILGLFGFSVFEGNEHYLVPCELRPVP